MGIWISYPSRFDDFIDGYNNERPHQARGMQYPAEHYQRSASRSIRLMNAMLAANPAKAQQELGISCRWFDDTLADSVAWAKERSQERRNRRPRCSLPDGAHGVTTER